MCVTLITVCTSFEGVFTAVFKRDGRGHVSDGRSVPVIYRVRAFTPPTSPLWCTRFTMLAAQALAQQAVHEARAHEMDAVTKAAARLYLQVIRSSYVHQGDLEAVASLGALEIIRRLAAELAGPEQGKVGGTTFSQNYKIQLDSDTTIATLRQEITRLSISLAEHERSEKETAKRLCDVEASLSGGMAVERAKLEKKMQAPEGLG